jgi:hypothetical protein
MSKIVLYTAFTIERFFMAFFVLFAYGDDHDFYSLPGTSADLVALNCSTRGF